MKTKECPSCGMAVDSKSKKCIYCGYEFAEISSSYKWLAFLLIIAFLFYLFF